MSRCITSCEGPCYMLSEVWCQCRHKWYQKIIHVWSECGHKCPNLPKFAQQSNPKCRHTGPSVARSDPDVDICGNLLTKARLRSKSLTSNKTKDVFFLLNVPLSSTITSLLLYATTDQGFTKMSRGDPQLSHYDLHFLRVKKKGLNHGTGASSPLFSKWTPLLDTSYCLLPFALTLHLSSLNSSNTRLPFTLVSKLSSEWWKQRTLEPTISTRS